MAKVKENGHFNCHICHYFTKNRYDMQKHYFQTKNLCSDGMRGLKLAAKNSQRKIRLISHQLLTTRKVNEGLERKLHSKQSQYKTSNYAGFYTGKVDYKFPNEDWKMEKCRTFGFRYRKPETRFFRKIS
jgi:hypothetical protein